MQERIELIIYWVQNNEYIAISQNSIFMDLILRPEL